MWRAAFVVVAITAAVWTAFGIVAAAFVASLGTFFVARRSTSGSVSTSDAATLFMELRENRREVIDELKEARSEIKELRAKNETLQQRVAVLENEVRRLGGKIID